jgi:hypothetical protein
MSGRNSGGVRLAELAEKHRACPTTLIRLTGFGNRATLVLGACAAANSDRKYLTDRKMDQDEPGGEIARLA